MKPPREPSEPADTPWYADEDRRKAARELLRDELEAARKLKPTDANERRLRSIRVDSAERIRSLLREKAFRRREAADGPPDLAAASHSVLLIAKAAGAVKKGVKTLLPNPNGERFARGYLYGQALLPLRHVPGEHPLLQAILRERAENVSLGDDALDELFSFHEQLASRDERAAESVYFLHLLLQNLQSTRELVAVHAVPPEMPDEPSFFENVVSTASYFEQVLLARGARDGDALNALLMELMASGALKDRKPDLYEIARQWYGRADVANHFVRRRSADGPFDDRKLSEILPLRVPAPVLANVLARVDAAEDICRVRHAAERLLTAAERPAPPADDSSPWSAAGAPSALSSFSGVLHAELAPSVAAACAPLRLAFPRDSRAPGPDALEVLRAWAADNQGPELLRDAEGVPDADPATELGLLLGALCSRRVVDDPAGQRLFLDTLARLRELRPSESPAVAAQIRRTLMDADAGPELHMLLPLEPCRGHPEMRGRTLRELLQEYAGVAYPLRWTFIVPTQVRAGVDMTLTDAARDFSGAVEPISERPDLARAAQAFKEEKKGERFALAWGLAERELREYLGADGRFRIIPNTSGAQAFAYVFDGLFPKLAKGREKADVPQLRPGDEILIGSQEYYQMLRERMDEREGRVKASYFPRHDADGRPFTPETLLAVLDGRITPKTRMMLLSVVSRFGDALFGAHRLPAGETVRFLRLLRERHPALVVVLDACQALGRAGIPRAADLDDHTILLGTGGKMLGVRECGFAAVPAGLAAVIQRRHGAEGDLPQGTTLSSSRLFSLYLRLRELRAPYGQHDVLKADHGAAVAMPSLPAPALVDGRMPATGERVRRRLRRLTETALRCARVHGDMLPRLLTDDGGYVRCPDKDRAVACRVFAPCGHHPDAYAGIVTLSFPALPAPLLRDALVARGFQPSDVCLDGTAIRFAFNEFQDDEHVRALFQAIAEIHRDHLQGQEAITFENRTPEDVERLRSGLPPSA